MVIMTKVEFDAGTLQDRDRMAVRVQDALVANTPLPSRVGNFRKLGNLWDFRGWGLGVWQL